MARAPIRQTQAVENDFPPCFQAFRRVRKSEGFSYLIFPNCLVLPSSATAAQAVFQYVHEAAHAQLSNTTTGLALQFLFSLTTAPEKILIRHIEHYLKPLSSNAARRQLLLYGQAAEGDWTDEKLLAELHNHTPSTWARLHSEDEFNLALVAFQRIRNRAARIWNAWRLVHEGVATFNSLFAGLVPDQPDLKAACSALQVKHDERLASEVRKVAAKEIARLQGVRSSLNARGLREVFPLGRIEDANISLVWMPVLLASHIPYHLLDLLDCSDTEYDAYFSGCFDFQRRLATARQQCGEVKVEAIDEASLRSILVDHLPELKKPPLRESWQYFSEWEIGALVNSGIIRGITQKAPSELLSEDALTLLRRFRDDVRLDCRLRGTNEPTIVFPDGSYIHPNPDDRGSFERNFVRAYAAQRTAKLISFLGEAVSS